MYFPGDPLFEFDPIFQSVQDPKVRERLVQEFELEQTMPEWALGYRFDIVLGGPDRNADGAMITPSQTVGPYFTLGLLDANELVADGSGSRGASSTERESRCRTRSSRSGRRTRRGVTARTSAGDGRGAMPAAATRSRPASPAQSTDKRRTSRCWCSHAACSSRC